MSNKLSITFIAAAIFLLVCSFASVFAEFGQETSTGADPNEIAALAKTNMPAKAISVIAEPNEPIDPNVTIDTTAPLAMKLPAPEPRKIVMPKDTKLPPRFKCPVHGTVTKSLLNIEIDGVIHTYCKKCAMQLVVDVFDLNLPRLINENP